MQGLQKLHRNYSSGAIISGSVHPTEENILLLNNIDMYNYTAVGNCHSTAFIIATQGSQGDILKILGIAIFSYKRHFQIKFLDLALYEAKVQILV